LLCGRILSTDSTTREDHKETHSRKRGTSTTTVMMTKSVTLLNSKLTNMTKSVMMLNKGSEILDEILEVGKISKRHEGIRL
jgi:hypothetical protein